MNNKEKLEMLVDDDLAIIWHTMEILRTLAVVPEDMMTPEIKKTKAACISFMNKYVDTLEETVDKTGIKKESKCHNTSFYPSGMFGMYGSYYDIGLKPWTPSKKALEEYERLKSGNSETITELTAKEQQKKDKLEAKRQKRKENLSQGKINLGTIKRISSIIYWQLKDFSSKKYKFPVNEGTSLALMVQKLNECNNILSSIDSESQKGKVLDKVCQKYEKQIDNHIELYIGDDSLYPQRYYQWEKYRINIYAMIYPSAWVNIIPGKEKEFLTLLSSLTAKVFQHNENPKNRWNKISMADVIRFIIGKSISENIGYRAANSIVDKLNAKNEFDEAAGLLEVSTNVKDAIVQNNPNVDGVTPYVRNMLIRMNFCDGEIAEAQKESEQEEEVAI